MNNTTSNVIALYTCIIGRQSVHDWLIKRRLVMAVGQVLFMFISMAVRLTRDSNNTRTQTLSCQLTLQTP